MLRYYINLVPYQLIKRSKFVYHYIPALLMGVQLVVFVCHVAVRWSRLTGRPAIGTALVAATAAAAPLAVDIRGTKINLQLVKPPFVPLKKN